MKAKRKPIPPPVLALSGDEEGKKGEITPKLKAGDTCPRCKEGRLDYDGLLNLSCPACGYALSGCFT